MTVSKMNLEDVYQLAMKRLEIDMMEDEEIAYSEITINQFSVGFDDDSNTYYDILEANVVLSITDELSDFLEEVTNNEKTVKTYKQPQAFINAWTESSKKDNYYRYTVYQG